MNALAARLLAALAVAGVMLFAGWRAGAGHVQASWDRQKAQDAQLALVAQRKVITDLQAQERRTETAEALNASLQAGYSALSDRLADSVRRYRAAAAGALHPPVADPAQQPGGSPPGPGDREAAELAGLTREATEACLATYGELKAIWAAEPPPSASPP